MATTTKGALAPGVESSQLIYRSRMRLVNGARGVETGRAFTFSQSLNQPSNQASKQPINQPSKQPTNQPINQLIYLSIELSIFLSFTYLPTYLPTQPSIHPDTHPSSSIYIRISISHIGKYRAARIRMHHRFGVPRYWQTTPKYQGNTR